MTGPPPARDFAPLLANLATQLERDRREFVRGNALYAVANLILAGFVWGRAGGGPMLWLPAGIALLANVFYALTAEWELRWEAAWRRELPRLERESEGAPRLSALVADARARRLARGLRALNWALTAVWLFVLMVALRRAGLAWGLGG